MEERGWRSGESTKSRRRRHMWVEFVFGSLQYCSESFYPRVLRFLLFLKTKLPNSNSTWNARTRLNKFLRTLQFYNLPVTYIPWRIIVKCKVDGILSRVAKQQSSVWNSIHCDSWEDLLLHREKPSDLAAVWASLLSNSLMCSFLLRIPLRVNNST